jgi:hypothetical protein
MSNNFEMKGLDLKSVNNSEMYESKFGQLGSGDRKKEGTSLTGDKSPESAIRLD